MLSLLFATSCQKDGNEGGNVVIESVWTNIYQTEPVKITSSYTGTYVRLTGSGFSGLKAIYCNGVVSKFNPTFVNDNSMVFQIPSGVPMSDEIQDENIKNTIRVVSANGEYTYRDFIFKDKNKMPDITFISYTMPKVGDFIFIDGKNFNLTEKIFFPAPSGEVEATEFSIVSNSRIKVKVPAGVGDKSGAIRLEVLGDSYLSAPYMFYREGLFIQTLAEEHNLPLPTGGTNYRVYTDAAEIGLATGLGSNPENVIAIPSAPADLTVAGTGGWNSNNPLLRVFFPKGIDKIINDNTSLITGETSLMDIAYQFDLYIPKPFNSGAVALKVNKDQSPATNGSVVYYYNPYSATTPYTFGNGWETVTIKFNDFPTLALGKLSAYRTTIDKYQSMIGFTNSPVNGKTAMALTGWQIFVANVRIVPLVDLSATN